MYILFYYSITYLYVYLLINYIIVGVRGRVVEYEEANKLAKQMNIHFTEVSRNPFHISEGIFLSSFSFF